ncbi:alpha/beta-hydrolase [Conidiobolus coronatus NRRL 28638]|uniref:Palmitoyl-protein thioesterase 1 n=1 Tax=Conidiobolus coronatus (strain ATCC 28846 / CBS 209.66 / NRRL 28638) TaxID=796925 RepID=A0A137PC09_CONC2|nr:alpha/beta-hydrolase [Conidiobolus coronatus NRRL 28638]|eukprot:KXN72526.1 alpha/beta-hydrolase [Conidiobolus coronatus NRRL 28638]
MNYKLIFILNLNLILSKELNTPVVLWHGLGDDCCNPESMGRVKTLIEDHIPGTYVHSIKLTPTVSGDKQAGFLGNLNNQIDEVCSNLRNNTRLKDGFNALGFSQGGLFLRAYMERCQYPPIKTLVTFGSPHAGIASAPGCDDDMPGSSCSWMRFMLRRGAYSYYVRDHVIQAQYFKDPLQLDNYYKHNIFLPYINNELPAINQTYSKSLKKLNKLVLVKFSKDSMIVPKDSAWFGFIKGKDFSQIESLRESLGYKKDLIGLRTLDEADKLEFLLIDAEHMRIPNDFLIHKIFPYLKDENYSNKGEIYTGDKTKQHVFKAKLD